VGDIIALCQSVMIGTWRRRRHVTDWIPLKLVNNMMLREVRSELRITGTRCCYPKPEITLDTLGLSWKSNPF